MNKHEYIITQHCNLAQELIDELYRNNPANETFEQVGILNGKEIVNDFIDHGELGVALDHLLYMIHESDIQFPLEALKELLSIASEYQSK